MINLRKSLAIALMAATLGLGGIAVASTAPACGFDDDTAAGPAQSLLTKAHVQGLLIAENSIGFLNEAIPENQIDNPTPRFQARPRQDRPPVRVLGLRRV